MTKLRLLSLFIFILTACNLPIAPPTVTASIPTEELVTVSTPISTLIPTPLSTLVPGAPLGTKENPIILAVIPSSGRELPEAARDVAAQLSNLTGLAIVPFAPASYLEVVEALGSGKIHIAWLPPFPYLLAHEKGYADTALASLVLGRDLSAAQFLVNQQMVDDRKFTIYFNSATGENLAEAALALKQFNDKKPCWTDPYSPTGYVVPLGILNENGIQLKTGAFVQGHATVVKSLYQDPEGMICQFGVTVADHQIFIASGYEDATERVVVVWVTEPIVPFDGVAYSSSLPDEMRLSITSALMVMIQTEEGNAALRDTYQIDGLKLADDTFYDALRHMLEQSRLELSGLVR
jgi:phosphonate transport system substrate-binding protein